MILNEINEIYDLIKKSLINKDSKPLVIGISGIGGSGKTSLMNELIENLKNEYKISQILFDGYHIERKYLSEDLLKVRGCLESFDIPKFKNDINKLFTHKNNYFPYFDHELKDPIFDKIYIDLDQCDIIFIEGLYIFMEQIDILKYLDLKIFLTIDINEAVKLVAERNFKAGISNSIEESYIKTINSDKKNAELIINEIEKSIISDLYLFNYIKK